MIFFFVCSEIYMNNISAIMVFCVYPEIYINNISAITIMLINIICIGTIIV